MHWWLTNCSLPFTCPLNIVNPLDETILSRMITMMSPVLMLITALRQSSIRPSWQVQPHQDSNSSSMFKPLSRAQGPTHGGGTIGWGPPEIAIDLSKDFAISSKIPSFHSYVVYQTPLDPGAAHKQYECHPPPSLLIRFSPLQDPKMNIGNEYIAIDAQRYWKKTSRIRFYQWSAGSTSTTVVTKRSYSSGSHLGRYRPLGAIS